MVQTTTLMVGGMDCADEVAALERVLRPVPGVKQINVSLVAGTVTVQHDNRVSTEVLVKAIGTAGLKAQVQGARTEGESDEARTVAEKRRLFEAQRGRRIAAVASGVLTGIGLLIGWLSPATQLDWTSLTTSESAGFFAVAVSAHLQQRASLRRTSSLRSASKLCS